MRKHRTRAFDFLCVGVQKSGTTWLKQCLDQHPNIKSPLVKEVQYFSKLYLNVYYKDMAARHHDHAVKRAERFRAANKLRLAELFQKIADGCQNPNEDWYRTVFSVFPNQRIVGEYTPDYFCVGQKGVEHMHAINPDAKIVIFVRDPVSRTVSSLSMGTVRDKKRTAMQIAKSNKLFWKRGKYSRYIPIWDDVFGDNVLYVPFGQIRAMPGSVIKCIETHIGAEHFEKYVNLEKKWNSWTGKAELSPEVIDYINDKSGEEERYLEDRFGKEFFKQIF